MKSIYDLGLHQGTYDETEKVFIFRVPGGWIYAIDNLQVFVPFHNEFMSTEPAPLDTKVDLQNSTQHTQPKISLTFDEIDGILRDDVSITVHQRHGILDAVSAKLRADA